MVYGTRLFYRFFQAAAVQARPPSTVRPTTTARSPSTAATTRTRRRQPIRRRSTAAATKRNGRAPIPSKILAVYLQRQQPVDQHLTAIDGGALASITYSSGHVVTIDKAAASDGTTQLRRTRAAPRPDENHRSDRRRRYASATTAATSPDDGGNVRRLVKTTWTYGGGNELLLTYDRSDRASMLFSVAFSHPEAQTVQGQLDARLTRTGSDRVDGRQRRRIGRRLDASRRKWQLDGERPHAGATNGRRRRHHAMKPYNEVPACRRPR